MEELNNQLILEIEHRVRAIIPENLIEYILKNGFKVLNKLFVRIVDVHFSQELQLYEVYSFSKIKEVWDYISDDRDVINLKLLAFGESLGSSTFCMSLSGDHYGCIYVFDYDFGPTKIAASLEEFLTMLK